MFGQLHPQPDDSRRLRGRIASFPSTVPQPFRVGHDGINIRKRCWRTIIFVLVKYMEDHTN